MDITKKAVRNRKDSKVKGSTIFNAFLENKKLRPKIDEVIIPDKIGRVFVLYFIEFPPVYKGIIIYSPIYYNIIQGLCIGVSS